MTVNGARVGAGLLTPGLDGLRQDLPLRHPRRHRAAAARGERRRPACWATGCTTSRKAGTTSSSRPSVRSTAIAQLRLEYEDGTDRGRRARTSDGGSTAGPITFSNVYGGEDYDARLEPRGWDRAGLRRRRLDGGGGRRRDRGARPAGRVARLAALPRLRDAPRPSPCGSCGPGVAVYDLGQNASMMPRLRVRGPGGRRGEDRSRPSSSRPTARWTGLRAAAGEACWNYTLAGRRPARTWFPRFFYHGSRYLQVERRAAGGRPRCPRSWASRASSSTPTRPRPASSPARATSSTASARSCAGRSAATSPTSSPTARTASGWAGWSSTTSTVRRSATRPTSTRLYAKTLRRHGRRAAAERPRARHRARVRGLRRGLPRLAGVGQRDRPRRLAALRLDGRRHAAAAELRRDEALRRLPGEPGRGRHRLPRPRRLVRHRPEPSRLRAAHARSPSPPPPSTTRTPRPWPRIAARLGRDDDARALRAGRGAGSRPPSTGSSSTPRPSIYATGSQTAQAMPLVLGLVPEGHRRPACSTRSSGTCAPAATAPPPATSAIATSCARWPTADAPT